MPSPQLCVGAVSQRVVQEAARLRVPQIIASRRQVDVDGGYTGWDQEELARVVCDLSRGETRVVRDHGGPNGVDDGTASLEADVSAGFDGLHIDVCRVHVEDQNDALRKLVRRFGPRVDWLEVGDERALPWRNVQLATIGRDESDAVRVGVVQLGSRIHADRQEGRVCDPATARGRTDRLRKRGVGVKLHNADWLGCRRALPVDFVNVAPELAGVEVDAWLRALPAHAAQVLLEFGYRGNEWARWFDSFEGTYFERARCGVRYVLETPEAHKLLAPYNDSPVRGAIRDAIRRW